VSHDLYVELLLVGEMVVKGSRTEADGSGDIAHGNAVVTAQGEKWDG